MGDLIKPSEEKEEEELNNLLVHSPRTVAHTEDGPSTKFQKIANFQ